MSFAGPEALPAEVAGLFASDDFVRERNRIARDLRAAGRGDEADRVAKLRKPPKLVAMTNRAARALPLQAQAAAAAAERLAEAQAAGDRRKYGDAADRLGKAVEKLALRAVEDEAGDRVAVAQLIRAALTSVTTRRELQDGRLTDTPEPSGFDALAGLAVTPRPTPERKADARRAKLAEELSAEKDELRAAEEELRDAEKVEAAARRAREAAQRRVESSRAKIERLERRTQT